MEKAVEILNNTSNVDKLERDLGLDSMDDQFGWKVTAAPNSIDNNLQQVNQTWRKTNSVGNLSESMNSSNGIEGATDFSDNGLIPSNWLIGNFLTSLPSSISVLVYDWSILINEKYTGLFLLVALLVMYSNTLVTMNQIQITAWFKAVAAGKDGWYKLLSNDLIRNSFDASVIGIDDTLQWKEFVTGWMHVTAG